MFMQPFVLPISDQYFPFPIVSSLRQTFSQLTMIGNLEILAKSQKPIIGLFCSKDCPGSLIVPAFDHVATFCDTGITVIGGFQSEMERECLKILLRGIQPIIIVPARSLDKMRLPALWKRLVSENRLLLLSPFEKKQTRVHKEAFST